MKLEKLPKPDGAPFTCTVEQRTQKWPYVKRCNNPANGLIPEVTYQEMKTLGYHGMRMICTKHADQFETEMSK